MAKTSAKAMAKKGGLTFAQLAKYDDVLTDALVDRVSSSPDLPQPSPN